MLATFSQRCLWGVAMQPAQHGPNPLIENLKSPVGLRIRQRCLASRPRMSFIPSMASVEKDTSIKKAAALLVCQLPDTASWDDLMYEILVRQKIDAGLADLRDGRVHDHAAIRTEFGVS
jgi:hypothetical protein